MGEVAPMRRFLTVVGFVLSIVTMSSAQLDTSAITGQKCAGRIYSGKEVERRARIIHFGGLTIPKEAADHDVQGTVIITAVLCRNGQVTDLEVVRGLPFGVTESAINKVLGHPILAGRTEPSFGVTKDAV